MVAPELANVEKLVNSAQQDYRTRAFAALPTSYEGARSVIGGYAKHCSYTGMKQLVNDSVTKQTKELADNQDKNKSGAGQAAPGAPVVPAQGGKTKAQPERTDASILVPASPN